MTSLGFRRARTAGFTLLEVMVALAVLAMALVLLVEITTTNVRNTYHAKMVSVATFLARAKMAELEDVVLEEGFVDNDIEEEGDFAEENRPEFSWLTLIEKVELPPDLTQMTQDVASDQMDDSGGNPMMMMAGMMGGFMSTLIEPIRVGLEEAVRRVSVTVTWREPGRGERSFEVETYMTDPSKLDLAVQAIGQPPGGADPNQPGAANNGAGTGTGSGTGLSAGSNAGRPTGRTGGGR